MQCFFFNSLLHLYFKIRILCMHSVLFRLTLISWKLNKCGKIFVFMFAQIPVSSFFFQPLSFHRVLDFLLSRRKVFPTPSSQQCFSSIIFRFKLAFMRDMIILRVHVKCTFELRTLFYVHHILYCFDVSILFTFFSKRLLFNPFISFMKCNDDLIIECKLFRCLLFFHKIFSLTIRI